MEGTLPNACLLIPSMAWKYSCMWTALGLSILCRDIRTHLFWESGKLFYSEHGVLMKNWSFGYVLTSALSAPLLLQGVLWYVVGKQNLGLKLHSCCSLTLHNVSKNELNLHTAACVLCVLLCFHGSQSKATLAFDSISWASGAWVPNNTLWILC